jgi:4-hydroxy-tetrahydrodipicolinate reductase
VKLALFGTGRMGREVEAVALERGHEITARLNRGNNVNGTGITRSSIAGAGIAIDFSTSDAVPANALAATGLGLDLVIGTTGWDDHRAEVEAAVREAGTGLLYAPNFSLGVLLFMRIVDEAARLVNGVEDFDVHLSEAHHRHKIDHPGGTARRLAESLVERVDRKRGWSTKLPQGHAVDPDLVQISVTRAGDIAGTHIVGFDGPDDRIELRHEARSRRGFARGAVLAAEWLEGRTGIFTLDDLLDARTPRA